MRKWCIAIVLLCLVAVQPSSAQVDSSRAAGASHVRPPVLRQGTLIRVDDGHGWQPGTLQRPFVVTRADTLFLLPCNSCKVEHYPTTTLSAVQIGTGTPRATHVVQGASVGLVLGIAAGAYIGRHYIYAGKESSGGNPGIGSALGALLGLGIGGIVGAALPSSLRWTTLELQ